MCPHTWQSFVFGLSRSCHAARPNCWRLVQVYNQDSVETVTYACSPRVIPVATARLNARRLVRMLRQPIAGLTTRRLWDFSSDSRVRLAYRRPAGGAVLQVACTRCFVCCTSALPGSWVPRCTISLFHSDLDQYILCQSMAPLIAPLHRVECNVRLWAANDAVCVQVQVEMHHTLRYGDANESTAGCSRKCKHICAADTLLWLSTRQHMHCAL